MAGRVSVANKSPSRRRIDPYRRRCVACGFDDPAFQARSLKWYVCDACGCDLYARPPKSYHEMEGIEPPTRRSRLAEGLRSVLQPIRRALRHG